MLGRFRHMGAIAAGVVLMAVSACSKDVEFDHPSADRESTATPENRIASDEVRRVLLVYSCGFNSLSSYLKTDIDDMLTGTVPTEGREDDVLLIYGHHVATTYDALTSPVLIRAYTKESKVVRDTVKTWPVGSISASSAHFNEVLSYIKENYPAREYDMVFTSHATGWLPPNYYGGSSDGNTITVCSPRLPGEEEEPLTKTVGETHTGTKGNYKTWQMGLENFAGAFPMKFESIMMDCCLMGGVEVAYALRNVCNHLVVSPAEILADGFAYKDLFGDLYFDDTSDPSMIAQDYFNQYRVKTGSSQSATITMVDCRYMEDLAAVCKDIFAAHAASFASLDGSDVQRFYRYTYPYFFDLRDAIVKAGATSSELAELDAVLDKCIEFKAWTPAFMTSFGGFYINTYCGLTTYLPGAVNSSERSTLDTAYKETSWNKAAGLVK